MIALRFRLAEFDDIFLAGLLHDTGIVFEAEHVTDPFVTVIQSLQPGRTLCETERQHLGFDHAVLGESVAKAWKFPPAVTDSIRYHHDSAACQTSHARTVQCVELANFLCSLGGRSSVGVHLVQFPKAAADALSLTKDDWVAIATDLDGELARNQTLTQL
jgi:HD-like signal output (HDOD) protein